LYNLDMGKELRALEGNQKLRAKYKLDQTLDRGKLTPTELVRKILRYKIHSTPKKQGILFNGSPKMLGEAKLVVKWLRQEKRQQVLFVYLTIPLKETMRRMTSRKTYFRGKFSKRPDDNNNALKNRVAYYQKNIKQVVSYFKKLYPFVKISTSGTIPGAKKRLLASITKYEQKRVN